MTHSPTYIYGRHTVREALLHMPSIVQTLLLARRDGTEELRSLAKQAGVRVEPLQEATPPRGLERDAVHQGVVAAVDLSKLVIRYDAFLETLTIGPDTALVVLNELQDPHNVGAVIRSAAAFGVAGVLLPAHRQAPVTGAVVKVSAGMTFRVPLVTITNTNATLADLKKRGFWTYGLEGKGKSLSSEKFTTPSVFVVGNEGAGLRDKTEASCDILLSIPIAKRCESLNAGVSVGIALYAWSTQHPSALQYIYES